MNAYQKASVLVGLVSFAPMYRSILKGRSQNIASWVLWSLIAGITASSLIAEHGNHAIASAYTAGNLSVAILIMRSKRVEWTWFESAVTTLVVVCLIIWLILGARAATVASTTAHITAGIAQLKDSYIRPRETSVIAYSGWMTADILSVIGGKDWSIEERLFPTAIAIYSLLVVLAASRLSWQKLFRP